RLAGLDLDRLRVAVAGRPTPQDVGYPHLLAGNADLAEQLGQQRPGATDKGQALAILLGARGLAYEHQLRVGVAAAEDHVRAGLGQRALRADRGFLVDLDQSIAAYLAWLVHAPPSGSGIRMGPMVAAPSAGAALIGATYTCRGRDPPGVDHGHPATINQPEPLQPSGISGARTGTKPSRRRRAPGSGH